MSARRFQRPTPINTSEYKRLGTSIMTTLAVLPHGSSDRPDSNLQSQSESSAGQHDRVFAACNKIKLSAEHSDEGACGSNTTFVDESPDRFLDPGNILADFDGTHVPVFIQAETRTDHPNVPAVREILEAYEEGFPTDALIKANFPGGDFQYHLTAYLRNGIRIPPARRNESSETEARLKDAYTIGVKEWCAAALDVFISQVEGNHVESSETVDGQQGRKPVLWTQQFFLEETASQQRRVLESSGKRTYKDSWEWDSWWMQYRREHETTRYVTPASLMLAGESDAIHMQEELRFISGLLRNISPKDFRCNARDIAHTLKSFGAPSHLVNLLLTMRLRPEDVAEYKRVESSAQGVSVASMTERVDLPRHTRHVTHPLNVLDKIYINNACVVGLLPPFLQSGYEANNFKTEAINKMIELYNNKEYDKALSVMDQEFHEAKEFHEQLFGLLRTAMRSYVPAKPSDGPVDSEGCNPHDLGKPLEELLHKYTKGLQKWCARVHEALADKLEDAITAAHQSNTEESKDLIKWVSEMEPTYTQSVKWFKDQIDLSSVETELSPPPDTRLRFNPPVARMRENIYTLSWLVRNMFWGCFLVFRTKLASLVREVDREEDFSFLANVLESLSFKEGDIDGHKQYYHETMRLICPNQFEEFESDLREPLSLQAKGAVRG